MDTLVLYRIKEWSEPGNLHVRKVPVSFNYKRTDLAAVRKWFAAHDRPDIELLTVLPSADFVNGPRAYMVTEKEVETVTVETVEGLE